MMHNRPGYNHRSNRGNNRNNNGGGYSYAYQPQSLPAAGGVEGEVITYVPESYASQVQDEARLGRLGRVAHFYTNRLGQEFTMVLGLSLAYQGFIGIFVGLRAIRYLPVLSWLPLDNSFLNMLACSGGVLLGLLFQLLLIGEGAQIAWVYRPDRLKNQLMQTSRWWWLIGLVLGVVVILDFLMIFMGITGTVNLLDGWHKTTTDNMTLIVNILIMALTLLTLLRCSVVMRTTTVEYNRKLVREQLETIAEELFLGSGEATRKQAEQIWKQLNVDPARFVPLQEAVINQIATSHPEMFPPRLGGDTWAYDFNGNSFVALPPDLHQALSAGRGHTRRFSNQEQARLWSLGPSDLSDVISFNLEQMGKPRMVDATRPEAGPEYIFHRPNLTAMVGQQPQQQREEEERAGGSTGGSSGQEAGTLGKMGGITPGIDPLTTAFADVESFWEAVPKQHKVKFSNFLQNLAYPQLRKERFNPLAGVLIYEEFTVNELRFLYEQFLSRGATGR
jgi:hypothetical protein